MYKYIFNTKIFIEEMKDEYEDENPLPAQSTSMVASAKKKWIIQSVQGMEQVVEKEVFSSVDWCPVHFSIYVRRAQYYHFLLCSGFFYFHQ